MTEEDIRKDNPWKKFLDENKNNLSLYKENGCQCYKEDKDVLEDFNDKIKCKDKDSYKYHLELPPCPWDGNPLTAKVIFLTLNPGYVEPFNKHFSKLVADNQDLNNRVLKFRRETLLMQANLRPERKDGDPISTFEAVEIMDDIYWTHKFKTLREAAGISDKEFWESVCVMQYIAYTSEKYKEFPKNKTIKSQEFTRDLIEYRLENNPPIFVVMRARKAWGKFLENIIDNDHFIFRKKNKKGQDPRGQFITENAFQNGKNDWQRIVEALQKTDKQ